MCQQDASASILEPPANIHVAAWFRWAREQRITLTSATHGHAETQRAWMPLLRAWRLAVAVAALEPPLEDDGIALEQQLVHRHRRADLLQAPATVGGVLCSI